MKTRPMPQRLVAAAVAAAVALTSVGPGAASAAAQEMAASAASHVSAPAPVAVPAVAAPSAALSAPSALPAALAAPLSAPSAAPAPAVLAAMAAAPSAAAAVPAPISASLAAPSPASALVPAAARAAASLAERVRPLADPRADAAGVLSRTFDRAEPAPALDAAALAAAPAEGPSGLAPSARASAAAPRSEPVPPKGERRNRNATFPLALAGITGAGWLALKLAGWGVVAAAATHAAPVTALGVAAAAALVATGAFALNALAETAVFALVMRRGRGTTDEQFRAFVRAEVLAGRLDPNAAALLRPYRPRGRLTDLTFAFAARGSIWIRPELISAPFAFRIALLHELHHWKNAPTRGPPARGVRGLLATFWSETRARAAELRGPRALKELKLPALERALREAQVSLRRAHPYEILVLNPDSKELEDPALYEGLSGGAAKVTSLSGAETAQALGLAAGKGYQAVVLGRPAGLLPAPASKDALRLESALKQLDGLYVLATRLVARSAGFAPGSSEARSFADLAEKAARLRAGGAPRKALRSFETEVRRFWRQIAATKLAGVGVADVVDRLYEGLRDRGTAFLSFGPEDKGVTTWERLLRYWEAPDGGQFRVTRVDLEDGSHILILRKVEARVGLWLRPVSGGAIETSVPRADTSDGGRAAARAALGDAGFADQLAKFDELGVVVRHVFGADVGRQEIYVTVPRRNATAIRKFVTTRAEAILGRSDFQTHLVESSGIMDVPPVWQAGITGADGKILWIDTGADATHEDFGGRLDVVDMVNEGPEDWIGHGTHVAGIGVSGGAPYLGMARGARGTMAKVFSREQSGASDGEIMGSAAIAIQKGYDVVSLSLGSRGASADNLADFFSNLTHQKTASGDYPIVSASAGNSGPFDRTLSQPAAGTDVIAVAAAAKSLDDGKPEIAFYSSVGPDVDRRYTLRRWRLKPDVTGVGGDVTTEAGSSNVYKYGVNSAKSKDAPRSPSDLEDGRHTGMSGTSMSNPAVAAIALLVKLALKAAGTLDPFVAENLPFAVKAVLMRTAKDLEAPVWFQGAGLVDAWAAVRLVSAGAGRGLVARVKRLFGAAAAPEGFGWIARLKAVVDAEDRVFHEVESAKAAAAVEPGEASGERASEEEPPEDPAPADKAAAGNALQAEAVKRFNEARDREAPALIAALKDPVWLVRQRAAFALLNLRASSAAMALAEAALGDADARVRSMAFLALAEIPTHSVDVLLQKAAADPRWDVGVYAGYALAKRGDRGGAARIVAETSNPDKRARYASVWLAGQLGMQASTAEAEALSARVKDRAERGNIRHLAAAALSNLADASPESISDRVVTDLLDAAGPDNLALTRTLAKFFPVAVGDRDFVARLRRDPLKPIVTAFVLKNKGALGKPGALAELVTLLAKAANVPLDAPTPPPDPAGAGVSGVDAALGPVDLIVTPPSGAPAAYADESDAAALAAAFAAAGLDAATLARFEISARAALPSAGALWLSVPEHKLYALSLALQQRGFAAKAALPEYPLARFAAPGSGLTLDLGDGEARPAIPEGADLSLVRVRAPGGVSEARVMAALEAIAARAKGRGPTVIALTLGAPTSRRAPLSALLDRLVASGVGVVVGAGNAGPALGTVASPGDARRAVVVAAAARENGLQFYSSRGTPESPRVTWTDLVDPLEPGRSLARVAAAAAEAIAGAPAAEVSPLGTAVAAERTAEKLARLAGVMAAAFAAQGRALPEGWFPYLAGVVRTAVTPMPAHGAHEVGAGLFDDEGRARAALEARLADLDAVAREAAALAAPAAPAAPRLAAPLAGPALRGARAFLAASIGVLPAFADGARALAVRAAASLPAAAAPAPDAWWKDASATRKVVTVPLYALRREDADPGVGKFTDLGRYYRETLAPEGVGAVLLLPHFSTLGDSPYAPVSLHALEEDNVDWSAVPEVRARPDLLSRTAAPTREQRESVDHAALRAREGEVAAAAWAAFRDGELKAGGARAAAYREFLLKNASWLDEYAEFMALSELIGKPVLDWSPDDEARARRDSGFSTYVDQHRFAQWVAEGQLKAALAEIHAAGGKAMFDVPMFRAKNSVDAWRRPEYFADLRTRNPGVRNQWVDENWGDLALWRWSKLKGEGYATILEPYRHWLDFGFDGARVDALHFAYLFGNGQMASGDEPGDDYVSALGAVFRERGAFPLAEAFEGKADNARRFGFVTVYGDWKKVSSHDDPRSADFLNRLFAALREPSSGANAKFVAWTLGDEWRDPFPVKEMRGGRSYWDYRIPLPSDPDYKSRARYDFRPQLRLMKNIDQGEPWKDPASVKTVLAEAADGFVKHDGGSVQIWAADMDWFLEEWGRDTFISLPGLLLSTGRVDEAKENIRRFSRFEHDGLIPNKIWDASRWSPSNPDGADYNTSDAPMWFVQAVERIVETTGDWSFALEMAPVIRRILHRYQVGTGYNRYGRFNRIFMDADGLVATPAQSTWMDADPEGRDHPVTPRDGKAVEINALWYSNLRFAAELERKAGSGAAGAEFDALATKAKASFAREFWFETPDNARAWGGSGGALRDVVGGDPHGDAIRPNMLFAVSRGKDLLTPEQRRAVVLAATRDLLTPYGPRTLSYRDSQYRERYETWRPPVEKDQAYHQGTTWPWLMGAYADALAAVRRDQGWSDERIQDEQRALMTPLIRFLASRAEGSLPEVFDGGKPDPALTGFSIDDPAGLAPILRGTDQNPGGTRSQAWSVAEVLRVLVDRGLVPPGYDGSR